MNTLSTIDKKINERFKIATNAIKIAMRYWIECDNYIKNIENEIEDERLIDFSANNSIPPILISIIKIKNHKFIVNNQIDRNNFKSKNILMSKTNNTDFNNLSILNNYTEYDPVYFQKEIANISKYANLEIYLKQFMTIRSLKLNHELNMIDEEYKKYILRYSIMNEESKNFSEDIMVDKLKKIIVENDYNTFFINIHKKIEKLINIYDDICHLLKPETDISADIYNMYPCIIQNIYNTNSVIVFNNKTKKLTDTLKNYISLLSIQLIDIPNKQKELICDCGGTLESNCNGDIYEYVCVECEAVFDKEESTFTEIKLSSGKTSTYNPIKHYDTWIQRIQGMENINIPEIYMNNIREIIKKNKTDITKLNCNHIRKYLKDLNMTQYNKHVVGILKILNPDIKIPLLEHKEYKDITEYFKKSMNIYNILYHNETIKNNSGGKKKRIYYPYFIFKIMEWYFKGNEKIKLIHGIHLQAEKTVSEYDKKFKSICNYNKGELGIDFIQTDYIRYTMNNYRN